jgi:hypothetical protein
MPVVRHEADPAADHLAWRTWHERFAIEHDFTGLEREEAGERIEQFILPVSLETRDPQYFTALEDEIGTC